MNILADLCRANQNPKHDQNAANNNADLKPVRLDKLLDFFHVITPQLYNLMVPEALNPLL